MLEQLLEMWRNFPSAGKPKKVMVDYDRLGQLANELQNPRSAAFPEELTVAISNDPMPLGLEFKFVWD